MRRSGFLPICIIALLLTILLIIDIYVVAKETYIGTITDIESVSAGGFMSSDMCIIYIDGNKNIKREAWCRFGVGDRVCRSKGFVTDVVKGCKVN